MLLLETFDDSDVKPCVTKSDCDGFNVPNVLVQMVTLFLLTMVLVPHVVFRLSLVVVGSKWTIRS